MRNVTLAAGVALLTALLATAAQAQTTEPSYCPYEPPYVHVDPTEITVPTN
jgi:hypothetical protein